VVFTERNLPKAITTAAGTTTFLYDATGQRVKKRTANGDSETVSLGGLYERRRAGATVQHIFYVHGTEGHLAQITYDEATKAESRAYVHPDALGSASAITDDNKVVTRFDHEPFGKRIEPSGKDFTGGLPGVALGFTGQRMDDDLGLVNLTGRIYDPAQRRFLSPDPFIPRPLNAQSYNRFSYVYNDPLNLIDPSGFTGSEGSGATCGGTIHPCPTPAPEKVGPTTSVASRFHVTIVPVVGNAGTGGDKWNPHTPAGRIQKELFGSDPEIDYLAATQPSPEVTRAVLGFVPGLNSVLVFNDPKATTFDKTLAVGTDVLAVVGVGAVVKLGAKGVGLAKGVVLGAEVAEEVVVAESKLVNLSSAQRTLHITVGDATGGGHLWPGAAGKTAFPQRWSADQIMHHVSDVATDSTLPWVQQTGKAGSLFTKSGAPTRFFVIGVRDAVGIKVIIEPAGEGIVTAFPH
jgi:RHS repeat-associated protein